MVIFDASLSNLPAAWVDPQRRSGLFALVEMLYEAESTLIELAQEINYQEDFLMDQMIVAQKLLPITDINSVLANEHQQDGAPLKNSVLDPSYEFVMNVHQSLLYEWVTVFNFEKSEGHLFQDRLIKDEASRPKRPAEEHLSLRNGVSEHIDARKSRLAALESCISRLSQSLNTNLQILSSCIEFQQQLQADIFNGAL